MREHLPYPRLVVAGTHSGSGKTSVVTALLAALRARGGVVRPFKVGPDYIDPAFHSHVTGVPSRNLDSWLVDAPVLRGLFGRNAPPLGQGLSVIEGVMGLFDGKGSGHEGSTAHVAELLRAPVILVIDARGLSRSAAALVSGYASFSPGITVAGVIANRVAGERQYGLIRESVEAACHIPCLGYLPDDPSFALRSRHLGLIPATEVASLDAIVEALGRAADRTLDMDALVAAAEAAPPLPEGALPPAGERIPVRLGIARDAAFTFYYQDNLDLLASMGAELVPFSPMRDAALPDALHGLYLGGGFPEVFAAPLAANKAMRGAVENAAMRGMPMYAECGGMAYLCSGLTDADGREFPMAGVFRARVVMTSRLQRFGYAEMEFARDTILGPAGTRVRVHEFHYSALVPPEEEERAAGCFLLRKGQAAWHGGLARDRVVAGYPHIHFCSNPSLARNFLLACREYQKETA